VSERSQLSRSQDAVRDGDSQHRRMSLYIQAILQPQRPEVVFGQSSGEEAPGLVAELRYALVHQPLIDFVVDVHALTSGLPR
jgi:hypothetical protein